MGNTLWGKFITFNIFSPLIRKQNFALPIQCIPFIEKKNFFFSLNWCLGFRDADSEGKEKEVGVRCRR